MNNKIQECIDTIVRLFTKRIGEVGVYIGAEWLLTFIAMLPMMLISGMPVLRAFGGGGGSAINPFELFKGFQGGQVSMEAIGEMLGFLWPIIAGGLVTLAIIVLVVQPVMMILRTTLFMLPSEDFGENLNAMIKNVLGKYPRVLGFFLLVGLAYIVLVIAMVIILLILGLLFGLLGQFGMILLYLILIVLGIGIAYMLIPVLFLAPFDAVLTDKPVVTCVMDAFNASKYRLPLLLIIIVFGIIGGILAAIFGLIAVPVLGGILLSIVASAVTLAQYCMIFPYYKEYAGLTA
jgi:hypothetical protein